MIDMHITVVLHFMQSGPDLGKKLDEAGISAAKRPDGAGGEAGGKFRWGKAPSR